MSAPRLLIEKHKAHAGGRGRSLLAAVAKCLAGKRPPSFGGNIDISTHLRLINKALHFARGRLLLRRTASDSRGSSSTSRRRMKRCQRHPPRPQPSHGHGQLQKVPRDPRRRPHPLHHRRPAKAGFTIGIRGTRFATTTCRSSPNSRYSRRFVVFLTSYLGAVRPAKNSSTYDQGEMIEDIPA